MHCDLFKLLINAYYNDSLEEVVDKLIADDKVDKHMLAGEISSLCGVKVEYGENFTEKLKNAIKHYESGAKIVNKVRKCSMDCKTDENGKTKCEESCPFDAIMPDPDGHTTYIDFERCTDCGYCVEACPTGSILDRVEFLPLVSLFKENKPVIAAVAPAIMGQYGNATMDQLRTAFKKLGFIDMFEVAFFADMLTLNEAIEFDEHVTKIDDYMITSCCCPVWVSLIKKVYHDLLPHVSPTVSPMIAAGRVLKALNPDVKVVFIGPCIAKKAEIKDPELVGAIDFVLTFSELKEIFETMDVVPENLPPTKSVEYASKGGRLYARTGGVSIAVSECVERMFPDKHKHITTVKASGVKECKEMLSMLHEGNAGGNFIEGMGCTGGCVGGPKAVVPTEEGRKAVDDFANNSKIKVAYDSAVMDSVLHKLGIDTIDDYKNEEKASIFHRHL